MNSTNSKNSTNPLTCPICDSGDIDIFIEIPQIPVYCNILYKTREEALNAQRADMKLGFCHDCGHVYNYAFNPHLMDYNQNYENSLYFSPRFQQYAEELARRLVERYQLIEKHIIEIGCGDGDFLALLCRLGNNKGVGFDPSHVPDLDRTGEYEQIAFVRDYYSEKYTHYEADFICCRHVLEHIPDPCSFLKEVRTAAGRHQDTVLFFEVPNVVYTLDDLGIWDLIYEHCSYFTANSLNTAFRRSGFEVIFQTSVFQNQFLCIESKPSIRPSQFTSRTSMDPNDLKNSVYCFKAEFDKCVRKWNRELEQLKEKGRAAVVWGAGSKGATFLNTFNHLDSIQYVVDINPRKQGKFVAGTGRQIVAPEFLKDHRPHAIIVMNPVYLEEIKKMVKEIGFSPLFLSTQSVT